MPPEISLISWVIPAWRALQTVCNVNIADLLVVDFLDRLRGSLREVVT